MVRGCVRGSNNECVGRVDVSVCGCVGRCDWGVRGVDVIKG